MTFNTSAIASSKILYLRYRDEGDWWLKVEKKQKKRIQKIEKENERQMNFCDETQKMKTIRKKKPENLWTIRVWPIRYPKNTK